MTLRHGARRLGHRRREHQRRRRRRALRRRRQAARRTRRRRSTPAIRTSPASRCPASRVTVHDGGRAREADRPQRRRLPAGDGAAGAASPSRGSRSARTTTTSAAATTATRSPARTTRARFTSAPTTTRRARRRCSAIGEALAAQPRRAQRRCSRSGRAKSSACSARPRSSTTPPVPLDQLAAYLNFDMVGRMQDNKLTVQATGTSPAWARLIEQANVAAGFDLLLQAGSVSADRRRELQPGGRAVPELLHRHARRLPQAVRHRRQDQLRGSRSHRRLRRGDRAPRRRRGPSRRRSPRSSSRSQTAAAAPACASSPARFPTTRPR